MQRFSIQAQKPKPSLKRESGDSDLNGATKLLRTAEAHGTSVEGGIEPVGIEEEQKEKDQDSSAVPPVSLVAKTIPFRAVPVIDMSQSMQTVAKQIGSACRNVGFFYIVNHGVSQEIIDNQGRFEQTLGMCI
jgi:hypothetical protein